MQKGNKYASSLPYFPPFSSKLPSHQVQATLILFVLGLDLNPQPRGQLQTAQDLLALVWHIPGKGEFSPFLVVATVVFQWIY